MTPSPATVSRRDAAIAAALAGTVVVVLGYASGLGVQATPANALITAPPAAPAAPVEPDSPLPTPASTPPAVATPVMTPLPVTNSYPVPTHPEVTDPTEPPATEPSTDPEEPADNEKRCRSGLEGLPVVGPATLPLTSVLSDFLATTPIVGSLLAPVLGAAQDPTSLGCLLGAGQ